MNRAFCVVGLLLLPTLADADPPSSKIVKDAQEREALLRAWEKGYKAPRDFSCELEVTYPDNVYQTAQPSPLKVTGSFPNLLLVVVEDQQRKAKCQFLMTEKELRQFDPQTRTEFLFPPPGKPQSWLNLRLGYNLREV